MIARAARVRARLRARTPRCEHTHAPVLDLRARRVRVVMTERERTRLNDEDRRAPLGSPSRECLRAASFSSFVCA